MNPQLSPTATKRFGRYRPLAILGRGGMADVYLAASSGPGNFTKLVVVKELKPDLSDDPEYRSMFLEEARLAARLNHPNVVQTYEVLETTEQHAFVMEYLDGQPMNRLRTKLAALSYDHALGIQLRIIAELLAGLHYAHELTDYDGRPLKIVHRDVSPHNVFITYAGEVKIVDFGIAKTIDSSAKTKVGIIKGKLTYMAPEQALGEPIDRRADVFAAGLLLWEATAGRRIWKGMQDGAILNLLATGELPKLAIHAPNASRELVAICERALAPARENRFATAAEFLANLEHVMRSLPCPGMRELGAFVNDSFQEDRTKIRDVIEEQMRSLMSVGPEPPTLPQLAAGMIATPTAGGPMASDAPPPMSSNHLDSTTFPKKRNRSSKSFAVVGGITLTFAIVVVLALAARMAQKTDAKADPRLSATAKSSAISIPDAALAPRAKVRFVANVTPKNARAKLDDAPIALSAPVWIEPGTEPHILVIEATGYQSRTVPFVLQSDETVDIDLERAPAIAAPPNGGRGHFTAKGDAAAAGDPDLGF